MFCDWKLQVLERIQPRLHLGDDSLLVVANRVDGQAIRIEQVAYIRAYLQHDFVNVGSRMYLVRYNLEIL